MTLVLYDQSDAALSEHVFDLLLAAAGHSDMLGEFFRAGDDARRPCRGESHHLLLVELGILEGGDPLDLIQQSGRKSCRQVASPSSTPTVMRRDEARTAATPMTAADKVRLFRSLFRGRPDVYPTRFRSKKTSRFGYASRRCLTFSR
jgi:hypothetical protein